MKQEMIELQNNAVNSLLNLALQGKESISLKAPTGSGKTRMMASFMDKMLAREDVVFIVSTLSKGRLAEQNFESFTNLALNTFTRLNPFYISSGAENAKNTEYSLHIDVNHNVFVLPTSQYTKASRINKEKSLLVFLETCKNSGKKIILIRDESHIATNQLSELGGYFAQVVNFSATPKNDEFDVCIKESEAEEANLIKKVEYIEEEESLESGLSKALDQFKTLRAVYNEAKIRPAFIIQISNKNIADEEMKTIKKVIEEKNLTWVCFVEKENGYESNSKLKKVKNKSLWQNYVKQNDFPIDVVIFKMVITEGFDMPRACMLYQVRNSQSKQLDEQVIGRIRRNPCLSDFEKLDKKTQEIFSTAYVYGIKPKENQNKRTRVKLKGEIHENLFENEIIKEFKPFKITVLDEAPLKDVDIAECLKKDTRYYNESIFEAYKKLQACSDDVKEKQRAYLKDSEAEECSKKWVEFNANLDSIKEKINSVAEDYEKYGKVKEVSLRVSVDSSFDGEENLVPIGDWIWTNAKEEFQFDSEAEKEWFKILSKIKNKACKSIEVGDELVYLLGKNFLENSNIKFDYYHTRKHTSYPDFIFKDRQNKIHIFEVKSVNKNKNCDIDTEEYVEKIEKLKQAYKYASQKTGYVFYIPVNIEKNWKIWKCEKCKKCKNGCEECENGVIEKYINEEMFMSDMKALV